MRSEFKKNGIQYVDNDFPDDLNYFCKVPGDLPEKLKEVTVEFQRPDESSTTSDLTFFICTNTPNIDFEFKIKRGLLNDKFFIGIYYFKIRCTAYAIQEKGAIFS